MFQIVLKQTHTLLYRQLHLNNDQFNEYLLYQLAMICNNAIVKALRNINLLYQ